MRIDFKRIEIRNFMSFAEESLDIASCRGMNLVQGKNNDIPGAKNGCGKSNIWAAVLYVLFGQLQTKIKNENLVNKYVKDKDMDLVLTFSVDGEDYKIRRGLAKGKSSYLQLLKVEDGKDIDITKSTIPETQDFIEKELIHCDVTIFLRTMLLTADQTYNFYMLKKADKKEFVEKLFDIGVFEDMFKLIHKDSLALEKESLAGQNRVMVLNKAYEDYEARMESYENSRKAKLKVMSESIVQLEKRRKDAKKVEVKSNASVVAKLEAAIEKLREAYDSEIESIRELQMKDNKVDLGIHKLDESKSSREKVIGKHKDILEKLCSDCKPVFMKHYSLDKMLEEVEEISAKRDALFKSKEALEASIEAASTKAKETKAKIDKAKVKLKELVDESTRASRELMKVESELNEEKSSLEKEKKAVNPYIELIEKCKADIKEETAKLGKIEDRANYLKFAEGIVSQDTVRKFIIRDLIVLLNNKIKTYLTKLGAKYYVEFDEDMDYEFITSSGTYEWSNFSAGERMRIMVATSFAFRDFMSIRNGLNSNLLVLDEYFDSAIDSLCVESIIEILKEYSRSQGQNVFVISHRPEVTAEQFDRLILVEKTDNIARLKLL